jgi:hypothetical protein
MSSGRFFITGLPRSRTAWFAVVAGARHEPSSTQSVHKLLGHWPDGTGVSDSNLGLHIADVMRLVGPRTLVIERPVGDVEASFVRYVMRSGYDLQLMGHGMLYERLGVLEHALRYEHPLIKRVDFSALNDIGTVRECLDWLGVPEPPLLDQLMHMNIQSDFDFNLALVEKQRRAG